MEAADATALPQIVDGHCHFGPFGACAMRDRIVSPLQGHELVDCDQVRSFIEKHRIAFAVLVPIYAPDPTHAFDLNTLVVQCAEAMRGKVVPGLWVDPSPRMRGRLDAALELARVHGIRVLKMSPSAWDDTFTPDPETWNNKVRESMGLITKHAAEGPCLLHIHTGSGRSDIAGIERLMRWAPREVLFQLVHMGNTVGGHAYLIPRMAEWLSEGLQVYCDTSLARGFAIRWLVSEATTDDRLAERILFASDEPWGIFESQLAAVLEATRNSRPLRDAILTNNARRLYSTLGCIP